MSQIDLKPLAKEGSAEWAKQMMLLGRDICNQYIPGAYYKLDGVRVREYSKNDNRLSGFISAAGWIETAYNSGWQIYKEPKPEPQYKVGDWVEHKKSKEQGRITYISSDNYDAIDIKLYGEDELERYTKSDFNADFRKLSPSEVVIHIGCLSGTIRYCLSFDNDGAKHDAIKIFNSNGKSIAVIRLEALDKETRELVESLLKAQEEE